MFFAALCVREQVSEGTGGAVALSLAGQAGTDAEPVMFNVRCLKQSFHSIIQKTVAGIILPRQIKCILLPQHFGNGRNNLFNLGVGCIDT